VLNSEVYVLFYIETLGKSTQFRDRIYLTVRRSKSATKLGVLRG